MKSAFSQPRILCHSFLALLAAITSGQAETAPQTQARGTRVEAYAAAVATAQSLDQAAEQNRTQRNYSEAIQTWRQSLQTTPLQSVWLKEYFWSRVSGPAGVTFPSPPQMGGQATVESAVATLKPGRFWNPSWTEAANLAGTDRPEAFWLTLLEALRTRHETEALDLLRRDGGRNTAMAPDVARALWRVLSFRQRQTLDSASIRVASEDDTHRFYQDLEKTAQAERDGQTGAISADLARVLNSDEAISAVLVAGGWTRAGLELKSRDKKLPTWLGFAKARMARLTR